MEDDDGMGYVDVGEEDYWGAEGGDAHDDQEGSPEPDAKRQKTGKQEKGQTIFQDDTSKGSPWPVAAAKTGLITLLLSMLWNSREEESAQGFEGSQAEHQQNVHCCSRYIHFFSRRPGSRVSMLSHPSTHTQAWSQYLKHCTRFFHSLPCPCSQTSGCQE